MSRVAGVHGMVRSDYVACSGTPLQSAGVALIRLGGSLGAASPHERTPSHMTIDRRLSGAALGLALVVAACGGSSSATAAASAAASQAAAATPAATSAPASAAASTDTSGGQSPDATMPAVSLPAGVTTALSAMIPDKVGTVSIAKFGFDASNIPWASLSGLTGDSLDTVLKDNGKTLADVSFAEGVGTDSAGSPLPTVVYALQVKGLDATKFASEVSSDYDTATTITVGGKPVKGAINAGYGSITYLHNDIVFLVVGSEATLNALVAALP